MHVATFLAQNPGDLGHTPAGSKGRTIKMNNREVVLHVVEKSDRGIVPKKRSNNGSNSPAEIVEGMPLTKGNNRRTTAPRTQGRGNASHGLSAVRKVAREGKDVRFTALLHHVTINLLRQSYHALEHDAAPGSDGMTWEGYGIFLDLRLQELHDRVHGGRYRTQPAKRVFIPKADGTQCPISIQCLEDKIVQQAVAHVLNAEYNRKSTV